MMKINEFISKYRCVKEYPQHPAEVDYDEVMKISRNPYVICNDGFKMSVQVGQSLYSSPRDVADEYEEAEIGFPSSPESLIAKYAEDWEVEGDDDSRLCATVYPYVPVALIDEVISKHGGVDETAIWDSMSETQRVEAGTHTIVERD
jgi:hypothetical protein